MKIRRKIKTEKGYSKEYDGLLYLRLPPLSARPEAVASSADRRQAAIDMRLSRAREWAGKVLRDAGLPDTLRQVQKLPDGKWTELPKDFWKAVDDLPDGGSLRLTNVLSMVYAQQPAPDMPDGWESWSFEALAEYMETLPPPPDKVPAATNGRELSLEWLACQLLERAESLESALAAGNLQWAALAGIELAEAWGHAVLTERFEIYAAVGRAQLNYGRAGVRSVGHPAKPEHVIADLQRQADAHWELHPGDSVSATAEAIKNKHGVSTRTIRRRIKKPGRAPR